MIAGLALLVAARTGLPGPLAGLAPVPVPGAPSATSAVSVLAEIAAIAGVSLLSLSGLVRSRVA